MIDDSGTDKVKLEDLKSMITEPTDGFSKDEIDTIADLIKSGSETDFNFSPNDDDDDTGRFNR